MTTSKARQETFAPIVGFIHGFFSAFLTWHRKRQDQRILDGLSQEQLKDIGYHRLPSGDLERGGW
jgi:uncharacterized protein YjiS (DUF1127 family)